MPVNRDGKLSLFHFPKRESRWGKGYPRGCSFLIFAFPFFFHVGDSNRGKGAGRRQTDF